MKIYNWAVAGFLLLAITNRVQGQTYLTSPVTGSTLAAGSYYNPAGIQLNPAFSFTASSGQSLQLSATSPDCQPMPANPSMNQNFVRIIEPRTQIADEISLQNRSSCELMQTVQYFDGLGRPMQTVQVKASPNGVDIVQPIAYDAYGREIKKYLPYAATTADGSFKTDALTTGAGLINFYYPSGSGASGSQQSNGSSVVANPYPFAETGLEASPLNRVVEQGAPGTPWQIVTDGAGHTVKIVYTTNNANTYTADPANGNAVALYTVTINGTDLSRTLVASGKYAAGTLYVTITKDENWVSGRANTTEEYKDLEGHVVLKRTYNPTDAANQVLSTYYVYDDLGDLAFVIPPAANGDAAATISQTTLDNLCYQYRYDGRNRLAEKKLPGKGWEYTVYNALDQVVATQDAVQRGKATQEWTFSKYDAQGRVIYTGVYQYPSSTTNTSYRAALQTTLNGQSVLWENPVTTGNGYDGLAWPQSNIACVLTLNYYDNYGYPGNPYNSTIAGTQTNPTGLLTATKTAVLLPDGTYGSMLWDVNFYDSLGRLAQSNKQHYKGGEGSVNANNYNETDYGYNFNNQVVSTIVHHYEAGTQTLAASTGYTYDHMGRKTQTSEAIAVGTAALPTPIILSQIAYNEIGQIRQKGLHSENSGSTYLQNIPFTYNERGWLSSAGSSAANNLFYYTLQYNSPDAGITQQFNGNIAEMLYTGSHSGSKTFGYTYDALNRLTNAVYTGNLLNEQLSYDVMGNIKTLTRTGPNAATLAYTYANSNNSNQLQTVTNGGSAYRSYSSYDNNGNARSDGGSKTINYNMLNFPESVTSGSTTLASYTYSATGEKLRNTGSDGNTWEYIDGIVINTNSAGSVVTQFIQTEEGRAVLQSGAYHYEYNLKDHLGNVRASFDKDPSAGTVREIQEDEYYAFGLRKSDYDLSNNNRYLYNGKELQNDLTNQYDYGARFYDPVIARWTQVDPLGEFTRRQSPYNYALNNPLRFIDATGMAASDTTYNGGVLKEVTVTATPIHKSTVAAIGDFLWGAFDYIPVASGVKQLGLGIYNGDWKQATLGVGMIALDVATGGEGSEVVKLAEVATEDVVKVAAEDEIKEGAEKSLEDIGKQFEEHHADPEFMGGDPDQSTTTMEKGEHQELHKDLNKHLDNYKNGKGETYKNGNVKSMRPGRGNSRAIIQRNFSRQERLKAMSDFYKQTGAKYGDAAKDFFTQHPHLK